ncbi:hypothetical protein ACFOEM_04395 [Paenalcaligenes hominis]
MKPLPLQGRAELQSRLAALKEKVKNDHKELGRKSTKGGLTQAEQLFLSTALRQINSAFMIRANTTPLSPKWNRGLLAIEGEVSYFIFKVNEQLEKDA